jgi:hypothetical protein
MLIKILLGLAVVIVLLLLVAAFKSPDFRVERSALLNVPAPALFDYVNNHRKFNEWNPWAKMDPGVLNTYSGPEAGVGAVAEWVGKKTGQGRATITESRPPEFIRQRMDWLKPMEGVSTVEFTFQPAGEQTKVTWAMYGQSNFMGRLMSLFMNMEKMCGPQFEQGLADLGKIAATKQ